MADRTVRVTLVAQASGYIAGMEKAAFATRQVGSETEKLAAKRQAFTTLGTAAIAFGVAVGATVGLAVAKFAEFDQAMSQVNAVTQESIEGQNALRDAALDAGGATVFTAKEAAQAEEELAKAGLGTADILGGALRGSLDLAASGQLEVARSAEITAVTLKQFQLDGTQAGRVADVLSAGANKAVGSVEDLAQALKFAGPIANSLGVSIEDTTATLAFFADQGIIGEQAGSALRGMLASLQAPSRQAQDALHDLGVSIYDETGNFIGMRGVIEQLNMSLRNKTQAERDAALGVIFTNAQLTTAQTLVAATGDQWQEYRDAVGESGVASDIAAARMDNLAGDIEKLGGAFDTTFIKAGSASNDVLRWLVQTTTAYIDSLNEMPSWVLGGSLIIAALTAAVALSGGAFLLAVPKIAAYKTAMSEMSPGVQRAGRIIEGTTKALGAFGAVLAVGQVSAGISGWIREVTGASKTAEQFRIELKEGASAADLLNKSLDDTGELSDLWSNNGSNSIRALTGDLSGFASVAADIQGIDILSGLVDITSLGTYDTSLAVTRDNLTELDAALADLNASGKQQQAAAVWAELIKQTDGSAESIEKLKDLFPQYTESEIDAVHTTKTAAEAYSDAADNANQLNRELLDLIDTINESNGIGQDAVSANIDYQDALRGVREQIAEIDKGTEGYARTLDIATEAGADNYDTLLNAAQAGQDAAKAQLALDGNTQGYIAALQANRDTILQNARDLGATDEQIQFLSDHIVGLPTQQEINILADTSRARADIDNFIQSVSGRTINLRITNSGGLYLTPGSHASGGLYGPGGVKAFAGGGFQSGIYPYTPGGIHKFAEAGPEAYISFREQDRARSIGIWRETGAMLGAMTRAEQPVSKEVMVPVNVYGDDALTTARVVEQHIAAKLATIR